MTKQWRIPATAIACVLTVAAAAAPRLGAQDTYRLSGGEVAVYNLVGRAHVVRGSGTEVVVRVTRAGADASRLEVETGSVDGREALRVIYPDDQIVYPELGRGSRSTVQVRADGTFRGGSGGRRVEIRGSGRGLEAWADLEIEVPAGRDFVLHLALGEAEVRGVEGTFGIHTGSGPIRASETSGTLLLDTGSGSASATTVRGNLTVDTGSGSVTVRDVSGGDVVLDTGSGGVRGSLLDVPSLRVDTGSGSIDLDEVSSRDVVLDTGSGGVELTLLTDVDRLDVDTGSGSVTIRAPDDLGAEVDIETGSGGIDLDFQVEVRRVRRDHVTGTLGDGDGRIRIDTGSGSVRLLRR